MAHFGIEIGALLPLSRKSLCVRLNMLKLVSKTEQGSEQHLFRGAFLLPKWSLAGEGVHICTTDAGSFFASLSDEYHIWIGGPQIEKN